MSDLDPTALAEMTSEVVAAYVAKNHLQPSELPTLIASVHAALDGLGQPEVQAVEPEKLVPPVSIKKSVTDQHLISMEDGKRYKSLKRHLGTRGLTPDQYRAKWGGRVANFGVDGSLAMSAEFDASRSEVAP